MQLRKCIRVLVCTVMPLVLMMSAAAGDAKVEPIPVDPENLDFSNGTFDVRIANMDSFDRENALTIDLYEADQYDPEEIKALVPGDIVLVNGEEYTVKEVGVRDDSWFTDEPETVYDIVTEEECWDGIWFRESDGKIFAHVGDWNPVTYVGTVTVPLPLTSSFVYYDYPGGEEAQICGEKEFLEDLRELSPAYFNPYNTCAVFSGGELTEVHNWSYPWGPDAGTLEYDDEDDGV